MGVILCVLFFRMASRLTPGFIGNTSGLLKLFAEYPQNFFASFNWSRSDLFQLYKNLTACQTLGNLCVLLHYSDQTKEDSCDLYRKVSKLGVGSQPES